MQRWGNRTYYTQLRLDPLPPENADELLDALLGSDTSLEPLKRLLIERTEGNPFFLEESVQTLLETGVLAGERGSYHLAKATDAIRVPSTVQAMLAARIDRLAADDRITSYNVCYTKLLRSSWRRSYSYSSGSKLRCFSESAARTRSLHLYRWSLRSRSRLVRQPAPPV